MSVSDAFRKGLRAIVLDNPEMMRICLDEYGYQHAGRQIFDAGCPSEIATRDVFMQVHLNYDDPITAGYVCNALNCLLDDGNAAMFAIHVGTTPSRDSQRPFNTKLLADLPEPFFCTLNLPTNECDGLLQWNVMHPHSPGFLHRAFDQMSSIPLEIGHSNPETLYLHAMRSGGFARWPYNSEWIYVYGCGLFNRLQQALGL